jgi:hypothetical protein
VLERDGFLPTNLVDFLLSGAIGGAVLKEVQEDE